ncbi:hypothetical protein [Actinokineospora globicatena]|uniref:Uncharacterized protein n=1 Tax=Actinokineospora globicatena TaxID=103729 RepID=A0A9W6QNJ1_9PSEU|nr:hypothetical protein [Actinokineospora globicatena]GLW91807.1 hypothetical protein Aglo03_26230 [Actinokineospora globicatena]
MTAAGDRARIAAAFRPGRQVTTPDTPRDIIVRVIRSTAWAQAPLQSTVNQPDHAADAALAALAASGYALVKLPEPTGGDEGTTWWVAGEYEIYADPAYRARGPRISIEHSSLGPLDLDKARALFTAGLAACDHAEQQDAATNHTRQETTDVH